VNPDAEYGSKWRFSIDRGGTFTDILGLSPKGELKQAKLPSTGSGYDDSGIEGIRRIMGLQSGSDLPSDQISWIRMGTTVATNALLERKGAKTALVITKGFRDILEIGTQDRPDLFALAIKKPELIYDDVIEVDERTGPDGGILRDIQIPNLRQELHRLKLSGIESLAIVFLFSWKNSEHERIARDIAREIGFTDISTSHETMPLIQIVSRGRTTLVDAYLAPVIRRYISQIKNITGDIPLYFMSSSGNLIVPGKFLGKDAIMSGPAGGVVASAHIAALSDSEKVLGFDMGGTSTDVCRYAGKFERILDIETAGVKFTAPMLEVQTVAAGGGSILAFDGRKLTVGPESAGANPGPACYGFDGPACITDANLILGRIIPEFFPKVFGVNRNSELDPSASRKKLSEIADEIFEKQSIRMSIEQLALGFIRIANETMCRPIKELSVSRGHDPREHSLIAFGGAGGQHACGIARTLDIKSIIVPPNASLLSAYGILVSNPGESSIETFLDSLNNENLASINNKAKLIIDRMKSRIIESHSLDNKTKFKELIELDIRVPGTDTPITIPFDNNVEIIRKEFKHVHFQEYGFYPPDIPEEILNIRIDVVADYSIYEPNVNKTDKSNKTLHPVKTVDVWFDSEKPLKTDIYMLDDLPIDAQINGPALIINPYSTVVVEPGFDAVLDSNGAIKLTMLTKSNSQAVSKYDPVLLEVFHNLFMGIARQMGRVLQRTAHSVNIKERLDFSCAVFDSEGRLVANAPHIPVHLGAMGETVRNIIAFKNGKFEPDDFYASNDPFAGGSHLPDITVVAPVFRDERILFYLASRGHHADIGGIMPGSMNPFAQSLDDEGVVVRNKKIVSDGKFHEDDISHILKGGNYPARNIPERLADLRAQVAAVNRGITEIENLCNKYSDDIVTAYTSHIRFDARCAMIDSLRKMLDGKTQKEFTFTDRMDSGAEIHVKIKLTKNQSDDIKALIDFTGTSPQLNTSLNAPPAVTKSAVLYVLRTLIERPIPLNDGCLDPIEIVIPEGSLLNPVGNVAVCGGNVETSQRVVDCLLGALGVASASQGTMNNLSFGSPDGLGSQYYETIAGGSGATESSHGASAVQVHMTNTRITDPEVIEIRFPPVRLQKFSIRENSGGKGNFNGGNGVIRSYRFLEDQAVSILSERRKFPPFGLNGGQPGEKGINRIIHPDGSIEILDGHFEGILKAGDILEIHTPGGGGFGKPS
jgi:5-oxoprolinase (ATP-hydrolysing)